MRTLFTAVFIVIGNTAALATWSKVPHEMRTSLLGRLIPLEHITRLLIKIEAFAFLLMTPEGQCLMRDAPRMAIPEPRPPPHSCRTPGKTNADGEVMEKEPAKQRFPSSNPAEWNAHFSVLHWRMPPAGTLAECAATPVEVDEICREPLPPRLPTRDPARGLARRVEALSRVLADPFAAIQRSAIFLAGLPLDVLVPPQPGEIPSRWWWHGRPYNPPGPTCG